MGSSDATDEEGGHQRYIWDGFCVSKTFTRVAIKVLSQRTNEMSESICIISAFRIKSIADLEFTDFTFSLINDGIWSALEPFLGIVNACLPILQPVIAKVGETTLFSRTRGSSKASNSKVSTDQNSTKLLHPDESDTKHFHRLYNHVYPLEDNPVVSNRNQSSCFGSPQTPNETNSLKQITVTTNWNVHTTSAGTV